MLRRFHKIIQTGKGRVLLMQYTLNACCNKTCLTVEPLAFWIGLAQSHSRRKWSSRRKTRLIAR